MAQSMTQVGQRNDLGNGAYQLKYQCELSTSGSETFLSPWFDAPPGSKIHIHANGPSTLSSTGSSGSLYGSQDGSVDTTLSSFDTHPITGGTVAVYDTAASGATQMYRIACYHDAAESAGRYYRVQVIVQPPTS